MIDSRFHPAAEREFDEAIAWLEQRRPGSGVTFRQLVEQAVSLLCHNPQIGAVVESTPYRHWVINEYSYTLFYEDRGDEIEIIAVAHQRRRPGYWMNRVT